MLAMRNVYLGSLYLEADFQGDFAAGVAYISVHCYEDNYNNKTQVK
jgi:hypothetical protein